MGTGLLIASRRQAPVVVAYGYEVTPLGGEVADYAAALREHASAVLREAADHAEADDVQVETVVIELPPAEALAELGRERDAEVIVVGTCGESPLRGALVGSTPHRLLQTAGLPCSSSGHDLKLIPIGRPPARWAAGGSGGRLDPSPSRPTIAPRGTTRGTH